jgi:septum formation protein
MTNSTLGIYMSDIILASSSRYRASLLSRLGLTFTTFIPNIDETALSGETPVATAERLSLTKAFEISQKHLNIPVIGADQVADLDGQPINKPDSFEEAYSQLTRQSGKKVLFHSGLAVVMHNEQGLVNQYSCVNTTSVAFKPLNAAQIRSYLSLEDSLDCAGSFKVEGLGISLFESVENNDPTSLMGLPMIDLCKILRKFSINLP